MYFIVKTLFSRIFFFFFAFLKTDYVRQLEDVFVEDDDLNEEFHRDTHISSKYLYISSHPNI